MDAEHYNNLTKENSSPMYNTLESLIKDEALKGLYHLEFRLNNYGWFREDHAEMLRDAGFTVNIFKINIQEKPVYVSIKWGKDAKLTK